MAKSSKKSFSEEEFHAMSILTGFGMKPEVKEKKHTDNTDNTDSTDKKKKIKKSPTEKAVPQERKTYRLNLLVRPSVHEKLSGIAYMKRTSLNDLINSIMADYAEANIGEYERYKELIERK